MKRYKVVTQREVVGTPCDAGSTLERQIEDFLNRQAREGWHYKDMITSRTADHRLVIDFMVLENQEDEY